MPYKTGMIIPGESKPAFNACVYETSKEAENAGKELMSRWFVPTGFKVVETDDKVNYKFNTETFKPEAR